MCRRKSIRTATHLSWCATHTRVASRSRIYIVFVIFTKSNELPATDINRVHTELYADGALLHQAHQHNQQVPLLPFQAAITSAENWTISWQGCLGHAKTKMMTSLTTVRLLHIENEAIDIVPCTKHLGAFSQHLDWHGRIHQMFFKAPPCPCAGSLLLKVKGR